MTLKSKINTIIQNTERNQMKVAKIEVDLKKIKRKRRRKLKNTESNKMKVNSVKEILMC